MERIAGSRVLAPKDVQADGGVERGAIEEQLALDRASKNPRRISATLRRLADAHLSDGDRDGAMVNYRRAVEALNGSSAGSDLAEVRYEMAEVERAAGNEMSAQEHYTAAAKEFAENGDAAASATCLMMLANARWRVNRPAGALDACERARAIFAELGDDLGQAHVFFQRAMRLLCEDPSAATADLEKACDFYRLADKNVNPNPGLRVSNPALPASVPCVRSVEPYLMAKVCERELEALETRSMPANVDAPEDSEADVDAPLEARQYSSAVGIVAGVGVAFALVAMSASARFRPSVQSGQLTGVLLAVCAAGFTSIGLRWAGVSAPHRIRIGAPIVTLFSVYTVTWILMGRPVDSAQLFSDEAVAWTESDAEPVARANSLRARAKASAARGDFVEAAAAYQQSLDLYRLLGDDAEQAAVLDAMARIRRDEGQPAEARALHEQALAAYFRSEDVEGQLRSVVAMVAIDEGAADIDRLAGSLAHQLRLYEARGNRDGQIESLGRLVDIQQGLANPDAALEAMGRLLALYESGGDVVRFASALEEAARLEETTGKQDAARARLNRAYVIHRERNDAQGMARTFTALGGLDLAEGELPRARASFAEALKLTSDAEGDVFTNALLGLGDAEDALGNSDRAADSYREALQVCARTSRLPCQARSLVRLGTLEEELQRPDSARASYERANDLFGQAGELLEQAKVLGKLAALESRNGDGAAAAAHAASSIRLASRLEAPRQRAAGLLASADAAAIAGNSETASKAYLDALGLYDSWGDNASRAEILRKLEQAGIGEADVHASNHAALPRDESTMPSRQ